MFKQFDSCVKTFYFYIQQIDQSTSFFGISSIQLVFVRNWVKHLKRLTLAKISG
uniref:Uncharacterized protein n=1 Tax=Rhizophagus irregularis (strain DAOM 181602 / DAOM 197198 / MUCL 43194) TaxID=747089 RepID=U9TB66_RHIID